MDFFVKVGRLLKSKSEKVWTTLRGFYAKGQTFIPVLAFTLGILWDVLTLGRIDQWSNMIQLGLYVLALYVLVVCEVAETCSENFSNYIRILRRKKSAAFFLDLRTEAIHFLLGSLLSALTIFFLKSASLWSSLGFIAIFIAILVGNETQNFRRFGPQMRIFLSTLCTVCYLSCLIPLVIKKIGPLPFILAGIGTLSMYGLGILVITKKTSFTKSSYDKYLVTTAATVAIFGVFYVSGWIPPVPLALTKVGIYRSVERQGGIYELKHRRDPWLFWQRGEQTFKAKDGDKVYVFFSVFAPLGFQENLKVKWYHKSNDTFELKDTMEVKVLGGRDAGYRGYAYKSRYQFGEWKIRIETADQREIGRIGLILSADQGAEVRDLQTEFF